MLPMETQSLLRPAKTRSMAARARDQVPFHGPIWGPPKIPRPFGALPYSKIWWSDSDSNSDSDDQGPMGQYYEMGNETMDFMTLEEYHALQEAANKTCFDTLTDYFSVLKRLFFGYSS